MFGQDDLNQAVLKLKQYIDASIDELTSRGSNARKEEHDEAAAWKQELGEELDRMSE